MNEEKTIIMGAGLAGLSCHKTLREFNKNPLGLERNNYYFGHARSYEFLDLKFDEGPHISFTNKLDIQKIIWKESDSIITDPKIVNFWNGHWIPHPVITNAFRIPLFARLRLLGSFVRRPKYKIASNYLEWNERNFGKFYTHNFAESYTRKYWQEELIGLSVDWAGARVYTPTFLEVIIGFFEWTKKLNCKRNQHYFSEFHYPKQGGFENLFKALEPSENFELDSEVVQVNLGEKYVVTKKGEKYDFNHVFNSIPIPDFLQLVMDELPEAITQAASKLRCTSLTLVDLVFDSAPFVDCHWAYVYDLKYSSTRFHFPQLFSGGFDTPKRYAIQVEVYDSQISRLKDSEIIEIISKEIVELGVFSGSPIGSQVKRIKYANVVFDHNHNQATAEIRAFLSQHHISLMGRYGKWDYSWSDDAIESGRQSALEYLEMEKS